MYWQNTETIIKSESSSTQTNATEGRKPQPRWGQACIAAYNKLYIIGGYEGNTHQHHQSLQTNSTFNNVGQYLGDVWAYDFQTLSFTELKIEGENLNQLCRSNHTAVFFEKHNSYFFSNNPICSIYVFGGGQSQRQRFNDTLKLEFDQQGQNRNLMKLTKVQYGGTQIPEARTYHASCLVNSFMVVIGGEANSDLKDFWALDLNTLQWFKPTIEGFNSYTAKRFHTASTILDSKIITFGGCHSEYIHMNEMHIFDMTQFLSSYSTNPNAQVICTKIDVSEGIPSTRWGHSAATYKDKLYILGGRNEHDIIDLHEFDPEEMKWRNIEIQGQLPKPRRRHSSLFVSGSLIMFGGFDGNFYNDLNILDFTKPYKTVIQIQPSTIEQEYASLVNNEENSDIIFQLGSNSSTKIFAHKALVLFRALEREVQQDLAIDMPLQDLIHQRRVPEFLIKVYNAKPGQTLVIEEAFCKSSFLKLLEFLYCDKFREQMTTLQVKGVSEVAGVLQLTNISNYLKRKVECAISKISEKVTSEFQQRQPLEPLNLTRSQQKVIKQKVESLEPQLKFDFSQFEEFQIQSPEDNKDRQQYKAASLMNQCKNLDEFYDIIFNVGETLIKANSTVLMVRSPYFQSMLSSKYQFRESSQKNHGQIKVQGVPKSYFTNIIQYIYSDHFYIQRQEVDFFVKLLIYADYFMLPRLVDICSSYLKPFVSVNNVLKILLVAHAHNAEQLENYCINFISKNEEDVLETRHWRSLKRQASDSLLETFLLKIKEEKEESYVQICIQNYINRNYPNENSNNPLKLKKVNQVKKALMSVGGTSPNEDELDLDDMLSTSTYIYLEDHQKLDSYQNYLNNFKVTSSIRSNSLKAPLSSCVEEEKEPAKAIVHRKEDKENISIFSNSEFNRLRAKQSIQKAKNTIAQKRNNLSKKRENKRQPLQQLEEEQQENSNPSFKRASIEDINNSPQEGTAQTPMQSQQTNNCNIFQRI